jgi:hypothetical protein
MSEPTTEAGRALLEYVGGSILDLLDPAVGNIRPCPQGSVRQAILAIEGEAVQTALAPERIAATIREVDGDHDLGAAELAERLSARLMGRPTR